MKTKKIYTVIGPKDHSSVFVKFDIVNKYTVNITGRRKHFRLSNPLTTIFGPKTFTSDIQKTAKEISRKISDGYKFPKSLTLKVANEILNKINKEEETWHTK